MIKAAANMNNDGGSGGNTGFMGRGRKKKVFNPFSSVFDDDKSLDSFQMASKLPNEKEFEQAMGVKPTWIENILDKFTK
jgi:hypothetical protein